MQLFHFMMQSEGMRKQMNNMKLASSTGLWPVKTPTINYIVWNRLKKNDFSRN